MPCYPVVMTNKHDDASDNDDDDETVKEADCAAAETDIQCSNNVTAVARQIQHFTFCLHQP